MLYTRIILSGLWAALLLTHLLGDLKDRRKASLNKPNAGT